MHFDNLRLTHFRNYSQLECDFGKGINCITGNNGLGKTNVLEAIHYLAMTRGFTAKSEKYALMQGEDFFMTEGSLLDEDQILKVQCNYVSGKGKKILVQGKVLDKMSDHIGRIPVVSVLPNDTRLIDGSPSVRRKFMDSFISQYDPDYLQALIRYDKILAQRNALLDNLGEQRTWDEEQVWMWTEPLIEPSLLIHGTRSAFLEDFAPVFNAYFKKIVSDKEKPSILHLSDAEENTKAGWEHYFRQRLDKDRFARRTTGGIHREDLQFLIKDQGVKNYGSQGQQKTFVISLKFAQYELLHAKRGKAPLLILDDIFDKLDINRLRAIATILDDKVPGQVFVTDTSFERTEQVFQSLKNKEVRHFKVSENQVAPVKPA